MTGAAAELATIQAASETETDYGGEAQAWTTIATLWVQLVPASASTTTGADQRPVRVETATATARDVPDVCAGQQLVATGPPWRILAVQRPQPGRMALVLDRLM